MEVPGYWTHETSGVLRPVIEDYLNGRPLTPRQIAAMRAYLRQWMQGPWQGPMIDVLRTQVEEITTRADIEDWLDRALDAGIDPL
jgi:hypothetical protein